MLLGELGSNAASAVQLAPGVYSFKPSKEDPHDDDNADENSPRKVRNFDMSLIPDLSHIHRSMIPGVWNRVRMSTFPENWLVIGFEEGSSTMALLESYGQGGLGNVIRHLQPDAVQFCGFRVSVAGAVALPEPEPEPQTGVRESFPETDWIVPGNQHVTGKYVFMCWVGEECTAEKRRQASAQLMFFRDFFHNSNVELVVAPPPGVALNGHELHALIAAQLTEGLKAEKLKLSAADAGLPLPRQKQQQPAEDEEDEIAIDFTNRDAPTVCTHYDWADAGDAAAENMDTSEAALQVRAEANRR